MRDLGADSTPIEFLVAAIREGFHLQKALKLTKKKFGDTLIAYSTLNYVETTLKKHLNI
jgi:hypothetical protein